MADRIDREKLMHSDGISPFETLSLIIPSILTVYITTTLVTLFPGPRSWKVFIECTTLLVPLVLNITVLSDHITSIIVTVSITCTVLLFLVYEYFHNVKRKISNIEPRRIPFLTNARATINVISVLAILAVDFQVFPRKYAKTLTFGYSLMDLGVGLYIFANSIVSPECLNKKDSISKIIKSCVPLFVLGMFRLVLTKQVDYHVPIAEYGLHWNFFFTLLFTKCISSLIIKLTHVKYMRVLSILVLIVHEILLQNVLQDIVLNNEPRTNFFLANKEGISSILGYVSLYLFSVYFGYILNDQVYGSSKVKGNLKMMFTYLIITATLAFILNLKFQTSRRLVNASYCVWIVFVGILASFLFYLMELLQKYAFGEKSNYLKAPYIYSAINYNSLIFFLIGNVFTGIINILWDTFSVSDETALVILILYMLSITAIMCVLYEKKIKLKF